MKTQLAVLVCCMWAFTAVSQSTTKESKTDSLTDEEIELPVMYQFEPNYISSTEKRREQLKAKISALDTLPISQKKRERLVKALYKDLNSEKFNKTILANSKFEDDDIE